MDKGIETAPLLARSAFAEARSWPDAASFSADMPHEPASYRGGDGKGGYRSRGGRPAGGDEPQVGLIADLLIRGLGLIGIGLSAFAGLWLHRLIRVGTSANPTLGQYALATFAFVAASLGFGLLILGRHIHDRIEVAERWRRRW